MTTRLNYTWAETELESDGQDPTVYSNTKLKIEAHPKRFDVIISMEKQDRAGRRHMVSISMKPETLINAIQNTLKTAHCQPPEGGK